MNRRQLLEVGGALASLGVLRGAYANAQVTRAAVVVGVDKCGALPVLNDAAAGASAFAHWLRGEGFVVREITDIGNKPVAFRDVKKAVFDFVKLGTVQELLIYFAGHGFKVGASEYWMLTEASSDANESIALRACLDAAQLCGIPKVFIVSDACRSTSASLGINQLHGGVLFPIDQDSNDPTVFDCFYATLPGKEAFELPLKESVKAYDGVFTSTFLGAYVDSPPSLVIDVKGVKIVDNHLLKKYLPDEVRRRVENKNIKFTQKPHCPCQSDSPTYIGRVRVTGKQAVAPAPINASVADVARYEFNNWGLWTHRAVTTQASEPQILATAQQTGFNVLSNQIRFVSSAGENAPVQFETQTGFVVFGSAVKSFRSTNPKSLAELLDSGNGDDRTAILRTEPQPSSVFIEFAGGTSTVLAVLPGFIGRILVRGGLVDDVAYVPSRNTSRWLDQPEAFEDLRRLHGTMAAAVDQGVFEIEGSAEERLAQASELVDRISLKNKGADPTLALYSAYALADAGMRAQLDTLSSVVRADLGEELFDLAMLSRRLSKQTVRPNGPVTPFCPMLTQGWERLGVRQIGLIPPVASARPFIHPAAIWTTFRPEGTKRIRTVFP